MYIRIHKFNHYIKVECYTNILFYGSFLKHDFLVKRKIHALNEAEPSMKFILTRYHPVSGHYMIL